MTVDSVAVAPFSSCAGHVKTLQNNFRYKDTHLKWNREGIWEERPAQVSWINFIRALKNIKPQARWTQDKAKCLDKLSLLSWPTAQKVLTFFFLTISQSLPTTFQNKKTYISRGFHTQGHCGSPNEDILCTDFLF